MGTRNWELPRDWGLGIRDWRLRTEEIEEIGIVGQGMLGWRQTTRTKVI